MGWEQSFVCSKVSELIILPFVDLVDKNEIISVLYKKRTEKCLSNDKFGPQALFTLYSVVKKKTNPSGVGSCSVLLGPFYLKVALCSFSVASNLFEIVLCLYFMTYVSLGVKNYATVLLTPLDER